MVAWQNNPPPIYGFDITGITYGDRLHGQANVIYDLQYIAQDGGSSYNIPAKSGHGSSYEVSGFLDGNNNNGPSYPNFNIRKTQKSILAYHYQNNLSYPFNPNPTGSGTTLTFTLQGQAGSPSTMFIIYDGDDELTLNGYTSNDNYPDSVDNHGKQGGNVIFCDGHAAWTPQKQYPLLWARGTDETAYSVHYFP